MDDEAFFDDKTISLANDDFNELDANFDNTEEFHYVTAEEFLKPPTRPAGPTDLDGEIFDTIENIGLAVYDCKY